MAQDGVLEWAGGTQWGEGGREVEVVGVENRRRTGNIVGSGGRSRGETVVMVVVVVVVVVVGPG